MTLRIALLRAVNVGGIKIAMTDLRVFFEGLGLARVRTYIQTGNVLFESGSRGGAELEAFLEQEAREQLGLDTAFMVRTREEWDALIAANPFAAEAAEDPKRVVAVSLKTEPAGANVRALEAAIRGPERIAAVGNHLYADYPEGQGRSKLTNVLIERKLETRGTARNWNTVLKIAEMAGG